MLAIETYPESLRRRAEIEQAIVIELVRDLLAAGYFLSVFDGEEQHRPSRDQAVILAALMETDEDRLDVVSPITLPKPNGTGNNWARVGWVQLVYGNDGYDVVSDYTTNLETAIAEANKLADVFEAQLHETPGGVL